MADTIPNNVQIPTELQYSLPPSLPSAKNFEMRASPINGATFQGGNVIQIDIQGGKSGQYLDPTTVYLKFKVTWAAGQGVAAQDVHTLLGSAYSYFNKQEVYANNSNLLESINELGVLAHMLLSSQLSATDKYGLAAMMGFNDDIATHLTSTGHLINNSAAQYDGLIFSYSIPLIGILGCNTEKLIPLGDIFGLRLELTCDAFGNIIQITAGNDALTGYTISNVELVGNIIEVSPETQNIINSVTPQKYYLKTASYRNAMNYLAAQSVGQQDILVGTRVSSCKSLYMHCSPANACQGKYASVNPNLTQGTCFSFSGMNLPQRTLNPSAHPADCYAELQKSFGALSVSQFNGMYGRLGYYRSSNDYELCEAYSAVAAQAVTQPACFWLGVDTEILARKQSLLSGINISSTPLLFRAVIGQAIANTIHTLYFWAFHDVLLEVDKMAKTMTAKI